MDTIDLEGYEVCPECGLYVVEGVLARSGFCPHCEQLKLAQIVPVDVEGRVFDLAARRSERSKKKPAKTKRSYPGASGERRAARARARARAYGRLSQIMLPLWAMVYNEELVREGMEPDYEPKLNSENHVNPVDLIQEEATP